MIQNTTKPRQPNLLESLAGGIVRRWLAFRYRTLSQRYGRLVIEEIDGVPLIVLPEVFNPVLLRTGSFMARAIIEYAGSSSGWAEKSALDMGTGSGVGAIFAARLGAITSAVDVNPEAVRCAQLNALLNRLEDQITVYHGDLFEPVSGQQFDIILFNPPFHRGEPTHNLDHAWRGTDVFERFAAQLSNMLTTSGEALLVLSSDGNCDELLDILRERNFDINIITEKNLINERVTMYAARPTS